MPDSTEVALSVAVRSRSMLMQRLLLVVAVLQMGLPSMVSIADAWRASQQPDAAFEHAEDRTQSNCIPVHAADCALCSFLSHSPTRGPASTAAPPSRASISASCPIAVSPLHRSARSTARPRAPPVA